MPNPVKVQTVSEKLCGGGALELSPLHYERAPPSTTRGEAASQKRSRDTRNQSNSMCWHSKEDNARKKERGEVTGDLCPRAYV